MSIRHLPSVIDIKTLQTRMSESEVKVDVDIEYCGVCNYKHHCLELSRNIKMEIPDAKILCRQGRRGSFEVTINETLVHSKLQTMALPDYEHVVNTVKDAIEGKPLTKVKEQPITECILM